MIANKHTRTIFWVPLSENIDFPTDNHEFIFTANKDFMKKSTLRISDTVCKISNNKYHRNI